MGIELNAVTAGASLQASSSAPAPLAPSAPGPAAARVDVVAMPRPSLRVAANPQLALQPPQQAIPGREVRFPRNLCYNGDCGVEMQRIFNAFNEAGAVDTQRLPQVLSGNVYWLSSSYDANHAHHGGVILDRDATGAMTFNGRWSFFARQNPYASTTVDEARNWSATHYPVVDRGDHLYVNSNPSADGRNSLPIEYWLRQNAQTGDVYVIGFWGDGRFSVGELKANERSAAGR